MKKLAIVFIGLFLMAFSFNAQAQDNVAAGDASASIIETLELTKGDELMFGTISPNTQASTVKVAASGTRTVETGNALLVPSTFQNGTFTVAGEANASYGVTFVTSATLTGGGSTMTVNNFETNLVGNSGTLDGSGTGAFQVGAVLSVASDQAVGTYTGTYDCTVVYE